MRPSLVVLFLWVVLIAVLLVVEIAEITHVFTIPIQSAIEDPLAIISALVFTTVLAFVGAIFVGVYVSHRILNPGGFTPFEEEMLRMRADLRDLKAAVEGLKPAGPPPGPPPSDGDPPPKDRP